MRREMMHAMTKENLEAAFAGESQAHMKYLIFANQAEKDGFPNVARLFRANAYAEQVHATSHFKVLEEMYPAYIAVAELQKERGAVRSTKWAREAEKIHAEMYTTAKTSVTEGNDVEVGKMHVCSVCGWTGEGDAPDNCPLCNAKKELFVLFE
jgi:rubrerythrin